MDRIDLTGSYTPDVSESNANAEALREHQREVEMQQQIEAQAEQEKLIESGEKSGPTLEQSDVEKLHQKYQDDPDIEMIDGKPFYKNGSGNIYAQSEDGTFAESAEVIGERLAAPGAGFADFAVKANKVAADVLPGGAAISDLLGMIPGFEKLEDFELAESNDPVAKGIREISEVVIPTLLGTGAVVGAGKAAGANVMLGAGQRKVAEIGASLGVDTAVSAIAIDDDDKSISEILAEQFGMNSPIAEYARSSPDANRLVQLLEGLGLSAAAELVTAAIAAKKTIDIVPTAADNSQAAVAKIAQIDEADPVASAVDLHRAQESAAVSDEIARVLEAKAAEVGNFPSPIKQADNTFDELEAGVKEVGPNVPAVQQFDEFNPFIHKGADPQEKAVINIDANPTQAKVSRAAIMMNEGTSFGKPTPATTESFASKFMQAPEGSEKRQVLEEFFDGWSPSVDAVINEKPVSAELIEQQMDKVVNATLGDTVPIEEYRELMEGMKTTVYRSYNFLGEEEWVASSRAFRKVFETIYDPENLVARGMMAAQAGDNASSLANAAGILSRTGKDSTRQQQLLWDKMGLLAQEIRANQYIAGKSLELKKLVKNGDHPKVQQWFIEQGEQLESSLEAARQKGLQSVQTFKEIAEQNPEYLQPFLKVIEEVDGNVDTLEKLFRYGENNIAFLRKSFYDFLDPEIPSWFVQGVRGIVYNSMLSGKAFFNAAKGNISGLLLKPASVFLGAARDFDVEGLRRATHQYAGVFEAISNGSKIFADNWRYAQNNPIGHLTRPDFQQKTLDNFEAMEMLAAAWEKQGPGTAEYGKFLMWNASKWMYSINNSKYMKYGVNGMYALDGFLQGMLATAHSRAVAYDTLMEQGFRNSADFSTKLDELQKVEYEKMFHTQGKLKGQLKDEAVIFQSKELALSLESDVAKTLGNVIEQWPVLHTFMRFPKTGANSVALDWSFIPKPKMGHFKDVSKVARLMHATTPQQKTDVLKEFGYSEFSEPMFKALKSEYIGRQMVGGGLLTLAGMLAFQGDLTGAGHHDKDVQRKRLRMGTDDNYQLFGMDYRGFGPISQMFTIVGTLAQNHDKIAPADMLEFLKITQFAITMGPASQSFLTQLEPIVKIMNNDQSAWSRLIANEVNAHIPGAGLRTMISDAVDPGLKVVEESINDYLLNKNRMLGFVSGAQLPDLRDIYSGERVRMETPLIANLNRFNPFFKMNPSIEDWRIQLKDTGWHNLQKFYKVPGTTEQITNVERAFIQNYLAENEPLAAQIVEVLGDDRYMKPFNALVKELRAVGADFDSVKLSETKLHKKLNRIHNEAFDRAWFELEKRYDEYGMMKRITANRDAAQLRGDEKRTGQLEIQRQAVRKQLVEKLRTERPDKQ